MSTNRPAPPRPPSSTRQVAERRSALPLAYLHHLPTWAPPVLLAALLVAGLVLRGWGGAVALCAVAAFLAWLAYVSWPVLAGRGRLGRVAAIACLLGVAALQASR